MRLGSRARLAFSLVTALTLVGLSSSIGGTNAAFSGVTTNGGTNAFNAAPLFAGTLIMQDNFSSGTDWDATKWDADTTYARSATSSVSGGFGVATHSSTYGNAIRFTPDDSFGTARTDQGIYFRFRISALAKDTVTRFGIRCSGVFTDNAPSNCYWLQIDADDGAIRLHSELASGGQGAAATATHTDTNWWNYRAEVSGHTLRMKRWADGASEPTTWDHTYTPPGSHQHANGVPLIDFKRYGAAATPHPIQYVDDYLWYSIP